MKAGLRSSAVVKRVSEVVRLWHEREGRIRNWPDAVREIPLGDGSLLDAASAIALINAYQWHEEDKARATDVTDSVIALVKRNIDASNQRRVNEIEKLDLALERLLREEGLLDNPRLPLSSETPGGIVDRLSILVLKIYHMADQSRRADTSREQKEKFSSRLKVLKEQLQDLSACLDGLLEDVLRRRRRFKTYFQFKMYNDPETNPYIKSLSP